MNIEKVIIILKFQCQSDKLKIHSKYSILFYFILYIDTYIKTFEPIHSKYLDESYEEFYFEAIEGRKKIIKVFF